MSTNLQCQSTEENLKQWPKPVALYHPFFIDYLTPDKRIVPPFTQAAQPQYTDVFRFCNHLPTYLVMNVITGSPNKPVLFCSLATGGRAGRPVGRWARGRSAAAGPGA